MSATLSDKVDAPYFPVARHKLIVMSLSTLSLYQLYWFYRNYQRIGSGSVFWRAVAAPLTARGLFAHVSADAQSRFVAVSWSSAGLAAIYLALSLICFVEYPWWTLALASVLALVPVHATMEAINRTVAPHGERNDAYSVADAVIIVLGIALTIVALYLTRREQEFVQQLMNEL